MKPTVQQIEIMRKILAAVLDTIKAEPMGAPAGIIYAALSGFGCSMDQYNQIIGALKAAGKVREENHLLFTTGKM